MDRRRSFFWPLALIAAGVLWILIQLGNIPTSSLWALVFLWPFLLIAAGLGLILRSFWKYISIATDVLVVGGAALAVFFAPQLGWTHAPDYLTSGDVLFGTGERGSGKVITQTRDVQGFNEIKVSYPAQVTIQQGEAESLTIEAEDNVAQAIQTQVLNGVLGIDSLNDHHVYVTPTKPVQITVTVKDLSELDFETAGEVILNGLKTDGLRLVMNGAGTLTLKDVQLGTLNCTLGGAGTINASGSANEIDLKMDGLGSFNGADLHAQTASVRLDGAGSATVWVDSNLQAAINGLGSVNYYGDPRVNQSVDGLGSVNRQGSK